MKLYNFKTNTYTLYSEPKITFQNKLNSNRGVPNVIIVMIITFKRHKSINKNIQRNFKEYLNTFRRKQF